MCRLGQARPRHLFLYERPLGQAGECCFSPCQAGVERDAAAFTALMSHLKEFDVNRTVLMVQVENEMGLLGDCRDFSPAAEKAYAEAVPTDAADFCGVNGTWDEAFGEEAPELFMTYHYAKSHPADCRCGQGGLSHSALRQRLVGAASRTPGTYPPAAPLPAIWTGGNSSPPAVDFQSPDIYLPDFEAVCREYTAMGNPCSFRRRAPLRIQPPTCSQLWVNSALWVSPPLPSRLWGKEAPVSGQIASGRPQHHGRGV